MSKMEWTVVNAAILFCSHKFLLHSELLARDGYEISFPFRWNYYSFWKIFAESFPSRWMLCLHGHRCDVLDARRAGSRYRFVESRKSRTVVKRGPVLACRSGGTRDIRVRGVPRRRDENADAETGIGARRFPISSLRTAHVDIAFVDIVHGYIRDKDTRMFYFSKWSPALF